MHLFVFLRCFTNFDFQNCDAVWLKLALLEYLRIRIQKNSTFNQASSACAKIHLKMKIVKLRMNSKRKTFNRPLFCVNKQFGTNTVRIAEIWFGYGILLGSGLSVIFLLKNILASEFCKIDGRRKKKKRKCVEKWRKCLLLSDHSFYWRNEWFKQNW